MVQHTIIVSKYGSVFRTRADLRGASAAGEQGETEGILRRLKSQGHRVVYFGRAKFLPKEADQLWDAYVESDMIPFAEVMSELKAHFYLGATQEMHEAGWASDSTRVIHACGNAPPSGMICVNGYSPTFSHVHNPKGATVQVAAIQYAAPILALCESLKIPRICVNNDPRTYPRDQEMSFGWEWARPRALLDQTDSLVYQTVGGVDYRRLSVHARVESWSHLPQGEAHWETRDHEHVHVIAHAHISDGIKSGSDDTWRTVFTDAPPTKVYSRGWEHFSGYGCTPNVEFMGEVKTPEVTMIMDRSVCCPVVSHTPGFYTGKPYLLVSRGCVPLLYGGHVTADGRCYDHKELLQSLGALSRIREAGDFRKIATWLLGHENSYATAIQEWRSRCQPVYTMLDEVADALSSGTWQEDPQRYGGYVRC